MNKKEEKEKIERKEKTVVEIEQIHKIYSPKCSLKSRRNIQRKMNKLKRKLNILRIKRN